MNKQQHKHSEISVSRMVEDIFGCKWSLSVLAEIRQGNQRPGILQRSIEGISTKVLNERLAKLVRYGIIEKRVFPEVPPRVEYSFTNFGQKFLVILDGIDSLQEQLEETGNDEVNSAA